MKTSRLVCFKHVYWCVIIPSVNLHYHCSGPVNRSVQTAMNWCLNSTWPTLLLGFLPSSEFLGAEKCWYIHLWYSRIWNHVWPSVLNWHCWIKTNKNLWTRSSCSLKRSCQNGNLPARWYLTCHSFLFLPVPSHMPRNLPFRQMLLNIPLLLRRSGTKVLRRCSFVFVWLVFCCYCCWFSESVLKTPGNQQKVLGSFWCMHLCLTVFHMLLHSFK